MLVLYGFILLTSLFSKYFLCIFLLQLLAVSRQYQRSLLAAVLLRFPYLTAHLLRQILFCPRCAVLPLHHLWLVILLPSSTFFLQVPFYCPHYLLCYRGCFPLLRLSVFQAAQSRLKTLILIRFR